MSRDGAVHLEPGQRVGPFVVGELLGEGGFAQVYRARGPTRHEVALKILSSTRKQERFLRESEILGSLSHPNVVAIYGSGRCDDGRPYYAMELVEGETLDERIDRGALSGAEARWIFDGVLRALEAAHAAGVVHRDVKPANILLTQGDGGVRVKLIDFGISRVEGGARLTKTGFLVGSPGYTSPESVDGDDIDERADLWSVGVSLFEAVTRRFPFPGDNLLEILRQVQGARVSLDGVPQGLRPVLKKMIAPKRARFASAREARLALAAGGASRAVRRTLTTEPLFGRTLRDVTLPTAIRAPMDAPSSPAPRRALPASDPRVIAGAVAGVTAVFVAALLGGLSFLLLSRQEAAPREDPPGILVGDRVMAGDAGVTLVGPVQPRGPDCPRAYECCVGRAESFEADPGVASRRCRVVTSRRGELDCAQLDTRWCARSPASEPCARYYGCCLLQGDRDEDVSWCDAIYRLGPAQCASQLVSDDCDSVLDR